MKGEITRSKSEIIIGNIYDSLKIPDFYIPDFTFTLPDGSKKYHEHLGMMDDSGYMETWKKKMILYYWADVIPGRDLFITADDCHGGINQQQIMEIIQHELGQLIGCAK